MNKVHQKVSGRVQHMLEAANNARSDIGDLDKAQFLTDGKTQRAVIESMVVIGEAANKIMGIDPAIANSHPHLWQQLRDVYDMRIELTHEYFRVDPLIVWNTVQNHLPEIEKLLVEFAAGYADK